MMIQAQIDKQIGNKSSSLVGRFIRERREALRISQRALGQALVPQVTTQFISNVERGVTPLPPAHVPTLAKILLVSEEEVMKLLEREYTHKLSGKLGRGNEKHSTETLSVDQYLVVAPEDLAFMRELYTAFRSADDRARRAFVAVCESVLNISPGSRE